MKHHKRCALVVIPFLDFVGTKRLKYTRLYDAIDLRHNQKDVGSISTTVCIVVLSVMPHGGVADGGPQTQQHLACGLRILCGSLGIPEVISGWERLSGTSKLR